MTFKKAIPFLLTISTFLSMNVADSSHASSHQSNNLPEFKELYSLSAHFNTEYEIIEQKATKLMTKYIDNAVSGTKRILANSKRTTYRKAVRSELPGAPQNNQATLHCLYGQYTQLNRAICEAGDTIQIIPKTRGAHKSCMQFRNQMSLLYHNSEYPNAIYTGHLFSSDAEYEKALARYIKTRCRHTHNNSYAAKEKFANEFQKNNFCATSLHPGTIIIVSSGHAIMYLGQGRIQHDEFVPDINGEAICCSYNNEHPAVSLKTWNTKNTFAADIHNIVVTKYKKETQQYDNKPQIHTTKNKTTNDSTPQLYMMLSTLPKHR